MSNNNVENKKIVKALFDEIRDTSMDKMDEVIEKYYADGVVWNGPQPFNTITNRKDLSEKFWKPFKKAVPDLQKNVFMHIAGKNFFGKNHDWVASSGHYSGSFDNDFVDIPATEHMVWVTYIEFNRLENGKIVETFTIIDMLDLIRQAGISFTAALAPEVIIPGPKTNDGVLMGESDPEETKKTFQIMYDMIWKGLDSFEDVGLGNMGLEKYFTEDFIWFGPCGIGTTRGIKGFERDHQKPFLDSVPDRGMDLDKFRIEMAEGKYGALIEWEGFTATHTGDGWLGQKATGNKIVMRDADFYLMEDGRIVENWCYMDVIDVLLQMGVDVFDRLRNKKYLL